jgi:hypothetical protein
MLKALHHQGVTGGSVSRSTNLLTRRELADLINDYQQHYGDPHGEVPATFRVGWIAAVKASGK